MLYCKPGVYSFTLQEFQEELQLAKPAITDGLEYGKHLLEDNTINEDNKAKIRQDVHHFEGDLVKLEQANDVEHKRYHLEACSHVFSCVGLPDRILSYPFLSSILHIVLTGNFVHK